MPAKTPKVELSPAVLRWSRESAGIELADVAKRLGVRQGTVEKWESGAAKLTLGRLQQLASLYKRPLAAFFLPQAPTELPLPHDCRVLPGTSGGAISKQTRLAIREARRVQALATELSAELGYDSATPLGALGLTSDVEKAAGEERARLSVGLDEQLAWRDSSTALRRWRQALEDVGIVVLQIPMPMEDARGFSLLDGGLPVIVINSRDAVNGRVFSLLHEYGDLLRGCSGICTPHEAGITASRAQPVERFCNAVAGAILVPRDSLLDELTALSPPRGVRLSADDVASLASGFRVSSYVILYRLRSAHVIDERRFKAEIEELQSRAVRAPRRRGGGPPSERRCLQRRGARFASLVLEAKSRDIITYTDVADYLSLRVNRLAALERLLGRSGLGT